MHTLHIFIYYIYQIIGFYIGKYYIRFLRFPRFMNGKCCQIGYFKGC